MKLEYIKEKNRIILKQEGPEDIYKLGQLSTLVTPVYVNAVHNDIFASVAFDVFELVSEFIKHGELYRKQTDGWSRLFTMKPKIYNYLFHGHLPEEIENAR